MSLSTQKERPLITLFGRHYAPIKSIEKNDNDELNGYYKRNRVSGVYFYDSTGEERAFLRHDGLLVSCSRITSNPKKRRYMFSTSSLDDQWLGIPDSHAQRVNETAELAALLYPTTKESIQCSN